MGLKKKEIVAAIEQFYADKGISSSSAEIQRVAIEMAGKINSIEEVRVRLLLRIQLCLLQNPDPPPPPVNKFTEGLL